MKDRSSGASDLAGEAYVIIRERILRGEVAIGQVISRRKIAAELGMSFLPVSEALLRLEHEGLLESRPRAGTRVRVPTRPDVLGHYVVREALEFSFDLAAAGTAVEGARLQITEIPVTVLCPHCREERQLPSLQHFRCPVCDTPTPEMVSGRELELTALEISERPQNAAVENR